MRPLQITMERFGPFVQEVTFDFPAGPGLYFLRGRNLAHPRMTTNAVGKTFLWKALTWLFFNTTVDGTSGGNVCTWGHTAGTRVALHFESDAGGRYTVERTWGPISWKLHDHYEGITDDTWEPVQDLTKGSTNPVLAELRLSLATWAHSVFVESKSTMFLDLQPTDKAALLGEVLGLDQWLDRSARASQKAQDQDRVTRDLESKLAELKGRLQEAEASAGVQQADWHAQQVVLLESRYSRALRRHDDLKGRVEELEGLVVEQRKTVAVAHAQARLADKDEQGAAADWREANNWEQQCAGAVHQAQATLYRHRGTSGVCPTCGTELSHQEHRQAANKADADLTKARDTHAAALQEAKRLNLVLADHEEARQAMDKAHQKALQELQRTEADLRGLNSEILRCSHDLDDMEDEAARLDAQSVPSDAQATQRRDELRAQCAQVQCELDDSVERHAMLTAWAAGFKEIRLLQIGEALAQLEIESNSRCVELGLVGWTVQFSIDRESKKGTVTRGFTTSILAPGLSKPVPFKSWSGGETQRLRLAVEMGLGDLCRARTGTTFPLEVYDEPTHGMSPQGITDLLECLAARAHREGRQIWVVDHHSLGYGGFDGVVTAVRTEEGSRLEVEQG